MGRVVLALCAVGIAGCGQATPSGRGSAASSGLTGVVKVDGSSSVFPITEAVAEEYQKRSPGVKVTVGISGTGGGFKKFAAGETDICDASRTIKQPEIDACAENHVTYIELKIAFDGLAIVVNPQNNWLQSITVPQLKEIWQPGSSLNRWNDVESSWPAQPIKLYGAGTDSGTFDYFTEVICGKEKASRPDYTASEDDNVLVTGIASEKFALGYVPYAYYAENQSRLKLVAVDSGQGPVLPDAEAVRSGRYRPLARPLFIYVKRSSLARPEVGDFVRFYLEHAAELAQEVGYVPLSADAAQQVRAVFDAALTNAK